MLVVTETACTDPTTWACAGLKNLGPIVLEQAGVVSHMPFLAILWGPIALGWGTHVMACPWRIGLGWGSRVAPVLH